MASKTDVEARKAAKALRTKHYDVQGHEIQRAKLVKLKGSSSRFGWVCESCGIVERASYK